MFVAIHINPAIEHQVNTGHAFALGLQAHGVEHVVTRDVRTTADVHVVNGPHYALNHWRKHPQTVLIDRAYYKSDTEAVSLGWLNARGGRTFIGGEGRGGPRRAPCKHGTRTLFLADYGGPMERADEVREHPACNPDQCPLEEALARNDVAIGYKTTALVAAYLAGLEVVAKDYDHILNQGVDLLPYADWTISEIAEGLAWAHLTKSLSQLSSR